MLDVERWIERLAVELSDSRREAERLREQSAKVDGLEKQNLDLQEKVRVYRQSQIEAVELYEQALHREDQRLVQANLRAANAVRELDAAKERISELERNAAKLQRVRRRKSR